MTGGTTTIERPVSIKLFAFLFALSCALSLGLAVVGARTMTFGFTIAPEAAHVLAMRILGIRLLGIVFALSLLLMIVVGGSKGARGALIMRWLLGLATSAAFLRGAGLMAPAPGIVALSAVQLTVEGMAIALLFSEDAAEWFDRRSVFRR